MIKHGRQYSAAYLLLTLLLPQFQYQRSSIQCKFIACASYQNIFFLLVVSQLWGHGSQQSITFGILYQLLPFYSNYDSHSIARGRPIQYVDCTEISCWNCSIMPSNGNVVWLVGEVHAAISTTLAYAKIQIQILKHYFQKLLLFLLHRFSFMQSSQYALQRNR